MNKSLRFLAVPSLALGALAFSGSPAMAADQSYQSTLGQLNGSSGSATIELHVTGDQAHVILNVSGMPATFMDMPYPHVQHIHGGAQGTCPDPSADKDGDKVISTTEGAPSYGGIITTLSAKGDTSAAAGLDIKAASQGAAYKIDRTFKLNAETKAALEAGTAVVVVHGLDPATLSPAAAAAKSDVIPELPLAATSPALCGTLTAGQVKMPAGGAETGITQGTGTDTGALAIGSGLTLIALAGGAYIVRRRAAQSAG